MTRGARHHTAALLPTPEAESFGDEENAVGVGTISFEYTNPSEMSGWSDNEHEWEQRIAQISRQESSTSSKASYFDFIKFDQEMPQQVQTPGSQKDDLPKAIVPPPMSHFPSRPSTGVTRKPLENVGELQSQVRSRSAGAHRPIRTWRRIHSATAQANQRIAVRQTRGGSPSRIREDIPGKDGAADVVVSKNHVGGVTGRAIESTVPVVQRVKSVRPQTSQGFTRDFSTSEWTLGGRREEREGDDLQHVALSDWNAMRASQSRGSRGVGWSRRIEALSRPQTALAVVHPSPSLESPPASKKKIEEEDEHYFACFRMDSNIRPQSSLIGSPSTDLFDLNSGAEHGLFVGSATPSRPTTAEARNLLLRTGHVRPGRLSRTSSASQLKSRTCGLQWVDHVGMVDAVHLVNNKPWPPTLGPGSRKEIGMARQRDLAQKRVAVAVGQGARTTLSLVGSQPEEQISIVPEEGRKYIHDQLPARPVGGRWTLMAAVCTDTSDYGDHRSKRGRGQNFLPRPEVPHSRLHQQLYRVAAERSMRAGHLGGADPKDDPLAAISFVSVAYLKALMSRDLNPSPPPQSPPCLSPPPEAHLQSSAPVHPPVDSDHAAHRPSPSTHSDPLSTGPDPVPSHPPDPPLQLRHPLPVPTLPTHAAAPRLSSGPPPVVGAVAPDLGPLGPRRVVLVGANVGGVGGKGKKVQQSATVRRAGRLRADRPGSGKMEPW